MTSIRTRLSRAVITLGLVVATAACSPPGSPGTGSQDAAGYPAGPVTLIVPAAPGGGWDSTARSLQQAVTEADLTDQPVEVVNREGGGGAIGLAQLTAQYQGDPNTLMLDGLVMVGALVQASHPGGDEASFVPVPVLVCQCIEGPLRRSRTGDTPLGRGESTGEGARGRTRGTSARTRCRPAGVIVASRSPAGRKLPWRAARNDQRVPTAHQRGPDNDGVLLGPSERQRVAGDPPDDAGRYRSGARRR
jgi:hypothetical protein